MGVGFCFLLFGESIQHIYLILRTKRKYIYIYIYTHHGTSIHYLDYKTYKAEEHITI